MKRSAAEVNELAITPAERDFFARPISSPRDTHEECYLANRERSSFAPRRHVRDICAFCAYALHIVFDAARRRKRPFLLFSSPFLFQIRLSRSESSPRRLLGKKIALIWFPRLTFRAPGAARGRTLSSSSRSLFSPVPFSPRAVSESPATRPGKRKEL